MIVVQIVIIIKARTVIKKPEWLEQLSQVTQVKLKNYQQNDNQDVYYVIKIG